MKAQDKKNKSIKIPDYEIPEDIDTKSLMLLSQKAFSIDWDRPEEDEAWKDL